jgi:mRNA interferase RelE/StbE
MACELVFRKSALKQLRQLPHHVVGKIVPAIDELANNPRPANCKKPKGVDDTYRIRIGNYRVLYTVDDTIITVEIVKIANRKEAYE